MTESFEHCFTDCSVSQLKGVPERRVEQTDFTGGIHHQYAFGHTGKNPSEMRFFAGELLETAFELFGHLIQRTS